MSQGRSLFKEILENFIKSLKPRNVWGDPIGKDQFGTVYYEIPSTTGRPRRWFVPAEKDKFDQELPVEWQAWLRHKRKHPPTEEEIILNLQRKEQTIANAMKLEPPKTVCKDEIKPMEKPPFPVHEEYEEDPGTRKKTGKQF